MFQTYTETPPVKFEIRNLDAENAFGVATYHDWGWTVEIDSAFFYEYEGKEPLKRVVFHELGHTIGWNEGPGIMDDKKLFKKITERELKQLFGIWNLKKLDN